MADIEHEFLYALCAANKADQSKIISTGISREYFLGYEAEADYMWEYHDKYGKFPATRIVRKRFPTFTALHLQEPLQFYADQLLERNVFQSLQKIMSKVNAKIKSQSMGGVKDALQEMAKAQELLGAGYSVDQPWSAWDAYRNYIDRENHTTLYLTPHGVLNSMIRGLRSKNLMTLVARPAMGKTWLMCLFALSFWDQGADVLFIEKEMTADEVYERVDALFFGLNWVEFIEGKIPKHVMKAFQAERQKAFKKKSNKFIVSDSEEMNTNGIDSVLGKIIEHSPDVVLIDGAYLLDEAKGKSFVEKATLVSRATKRLAKNRNVLIMQSLQLNRQAEEEAATIGNIAWSDAYGQDSDVIVSLKGDRTEPTRIIELLKARTIASGGIGEYYVNFGFSPKLNFNEIKAGSSSRTIKLSTIEG